MEPPPIHHFSYRISNIHLFFLDSMNTIEGGAPFLDENYVLSEEEMKAELGRSFPIQKTDTYKRKE